MNSFFVSFTLYSLSFPYKLTFNLYFLKLGSTVVVDINLCTDSTHGDRGWYYDNDMLVETGRTADNADECMERCFDLLGCNYWTRGTDQMCYLLKSHTGRTLERTGFASGDHLCKCNTLIAVLQDFLTIVLAI